MLTQKALTKNLIATLCTTTNTLFVHNNKMDCFSEFSHFFNFRWFCDGFTMKFASPTEFAARGCPQISPGLNFHLK